MTIEEFLKDKLKKGSGGGKTQSELAGNSHQQTIFKLLSDEQQIANTQFKTILSIFPEVRMVLERAFCASSGGSSASVSGNGSAAAVNGNATAAPVICASPSPDREKLTSAVLNDDAICDACKVKVLKLLQKKQ